MTKKTTDLALALPHARQGLRIPSHKFYNVESNDFTIEVWFRAKHATTLVSRYQKDRWENEEGRFLFDLNEDEVLFKMESLGNRGINEHSLTVKSNLLDNRWHHLTAKRESGVLSIYVDGKLSKGVVKNDFGSGKSVSLNTDLPLIIGHAPHIQGTEDDSRQITQVRFWNTARMSTDILNLMYHHLSGKEEHLIGLWNFDEGSGKDGSSLKNHGELRWGGDYVPTNMALIPSGKPYMYTQCSLMQDYKQSHPRSPRAHEVSGYRVSLSPKKADGTPYKGKLLIKASERVEAHINGKPNVLEPSKSVIIDTHVMGEVDIVLEANGKLTAPFLEVQTEDMVSEGRKAIISPDAHLHSSLSKVTAKQLKGQHDKDAPLPGLNRKKEALLKGEYVKHAEPLAKALNNLTTGSSEHQVFPMIPLFHAAQIAKGEEGAEFVPVGTARIPHPFHHDHDMTRHHSLKHDKDGLRITMAEHMPDKHWIYDYKAVSFKSLTDEEVKEELDSLNEIEHGDALSAYYSTLSDSNETTVTLGLEQLQGDFLTISQNPYLKKWSFWGALKNAVKAIVKTVTHVIREIGKAIKSVVVTIVDAVGKAVDFVLHTVEKIGEAVESFVKKVKATVEQAIGFFRGLFDWEDILTVHDALHNYVKVSFEQVVNSIEGAKEHAHLFFQNIEHKINEHFDAGIEKMKGQSAGTKGGGSQHGVSGGIQSKWMNSTFSHHSESTRFSIPTSEVDPTDHIHTMHGHIDPHMDTFTGFAGGFKENSDPLHWLFAELMEAVKELLVTAVDLADKATQGILEIAKKMADYFLDLLDTRINIPIITWLYENVIAPGRILTVMDLMSLAAAIPVAVIYKLAKGGEFDAKDREALEVMKKMTVGDIHWLRIPKPGEEINQKTSSVGEDIFNTITVLLGVAAWGATGIWGILKTTSDVIAAAADEVPGLLSGLTLVANLFSTFFSTPLEYTVFIGTIKPWDIPVYLAELAVWGLKCFAWFILLLAFIASLAGVDKKMLAKVKQVFLFIVGCILFLAYIPINIVQKSDPFKWLQNLTSTIVPIGQVAAFLPKNWIWIWPIITASGFGLTSMFGLIRLYDAAQNRKKYTII